MQGFKEYINEQKINEGFSSMVGKVEKWLINNVDLIKKKYISHQKSYANERIIIINPSKDLTIQSTKNGFVYIIGKDKKGNDNYFMIDENSLDDFESDVTGDAPRMFVCARMTDFENHGIVPLFIYDIKEY